MDRVFVVWGSTGEYSDHREWMVAAYADENAAKEAITRLDESVRMMKMEIRRLREADEFDYDKERRIIGGEPLDPQRQTDYTGTQYAYEAVPFYASNPH